MKPALGTPFRKPIANFYQTDPISRASPTMAKCTQAFVLKTPNYREKFDRTAYDVSQ